MAMVCAWRGGVSMLGGDMHLDEHALCFWLNMLHKSIVYIYNTHNCVCIHTTNKSCIYPHHHHHHNNNNNIDAPVMWQHALLAMWGQNVWLLSMRLDEAFVTHVPGPINTLLQDGCMPKIASGVSDTHDAGQGTAWVLPRHAAWCDGPGDVVQVPSECVGSNRMGEGMLPGGPAVCGVCIEYCKSTPCTDFFTCMCTVHNRQ